MPLHGAYRQRRGVLAEGQAQRHQQGQGARENVDDPDLLVADLLEQPQAVEEQHRADIQ